MISQKHNTACLLLDKDNKFLLIQRTSKDDSLPGFWELPSGGIDEGEPVKESAARETKEEVGIDISKYELKQVDSEKYSLTKENGDIKNVKETTFLVKLEEQLKVILSEEHVAYQWVNLEELEKVFEDKEDLIYKRIHRIFENL